MNRRDALVVAAAGGWAAAEPLGSTPAGAAAGDPEGHTRWVLERLREMRTIQPGMTRHDLGARFRTGRGLYKRTRRDYLLRACPYFKIIVEFDPVDEESDAEDGRDVIKSVSAPFVDDANVDA